MRLRRDIIFTFVSKLDLNARQVRTQQRKIKQHKNIKIKPMR